MQRRYQILLLALLTSLLATACLPKSVTKGGKGGKRGADAATTGTSDLTLQFDDSAFNKYHVGKENLSFRFLYHGVDLKGPIVFQGAQGTVSLTALPTETAGDIKLEIYVSSALKMVGILRNISLKSGANAHTITEFTIDGIELNAGWDGKTFQGNHNWRVEGS